MGLKPKLYMAPEFGVTPTGVYPFSACYKYCNYCYPIYCYCYG